MRRPCEAAPEAGPTFSVIIPTFNRPEMLFRAVSSVLSQTYQSFELIIVNDGSTCDYSVVLDRIHDPRAIVMDCRQQGGAAVARNKGIEASSGAYVAFLDDDDEMHEGFLQSTYDAFRSFASQVGVSWCGVEQLDYPVTDTEQLTIRLQEFPTTYPSKQALFETLLSIGTGYGICVSAACLQAVGGFNHKLRTTEDTDWFIRILEAGFEPAPVPGIHMRLHNHTQSRLTDSSMISVNIEECFVLIREHAHFFDTYPTMRDQMFGHIRFLEASRAEKQARARGISGIRPPSEQEKVSLAPSPRSAVAHPARNRASMVKSQGR